MTDTTSVPYVVWLENVSMRDVALVGGKNASLGELIRSLGHQGVRVPGGFATTTHAYRDVVALNALQAPIGAALQALREGRAALVDTGRDVRERILAAPLPEHVEQELRAAYRELERRTRRKNVDIAVRSSATAEDLPEASFAGQQETLLNVRGADALVAACRRCLASLFTDRDQLSRESRNR